MVKELTVIEATRRLGITIDAVYRLIYAGRLPARKSGRRWLVSGVAVEERLRARNERNGTPVPMAAKRQDG
jgi:excisionase family DNA binding protein